MICDPAVGTCGFLVAAGEYLRKHHASLFRGGQGGYAAGGGGAVDCWLDSLDFGGESISGSEPEKRCTEDTEYPPGLRRDE